MNRLTYQGSTLFRKKCYRSKENKKETIKRLMEYEDTGKTPEEISKLADENRKSYQDNKILWQALAMIVAKYGDITISANDADQYYIQPSDISLHYDSIAEEYHIAKRKQQPTNDEMTAQETT